MPSTDQLTNLLRNVSLNDSTQRRPKPASPPKSFLETMNEKLAAQRPGRPQRRWKGNHNQFQSRVMAPVDPSLYYIVDDQRAFLGVYSTATTATRAARLAGAFEGYLARWVEDGMMGGEGLRILPQKLRDARSGRGEQREAESKHIIDKQGGDVHRETPGVSPENEPDDRGEKVVGSSGEDHSKQRTEESDRKDSSTCTNAQTEKSASADVPIPPRPETVKLVYVALDHSLCLGLFTEKSGAWEACIKHKTQMTYSTSLKEQKQWVDKDGMPYLQGKIAGSGRHCWYVRECVVDEMPPKRKRRV